MRRASSRSAHEREDAEDDAEDALGVDVEDVVRDLAVGAEEERDGVQGPQGRESVRPLVAGGGRRDVQGRPHHEEGGEKEAERDPRRERRRRVRRVLATSDRGDVAAQKHQLAGSAAAEKPAEVRDDGAEQVEELDEHEDRGDVPVRVPYRHQLRRVPDPSHPLVVEAGDEADGGAEGVAERVGPLFPQGGHRGGGQLEERDADEAGGGGAEGDALEGRADRFDEIERRRRSRRRRGDDGGGGVSPSSSGRGDVVLRTVRGRHDGTARPHRSFERPFFFSNDCRTRATIDDAGFFCVLPFEQKVRCSRIWRTNTSPPTQT